MEGHEDMNVQLLAIETAKTIAEKELLSADQVQPSSLVGPVDPSFRALSGCLNFTVRRH